MALEEDDALRDGSDRRKRSGPIHDTYCNSLWSDALYGRQFLATNFPEWRKPYDLSRIELGATSFSDKEQRHFLSDMVYRIPSAEEFGTPLWLSLLFEFKTTSGVRENRQTALSIARYAASNMLAELENSPTGLIPQTISLLVYSGPDPNFWLPSWSELFPVGPGCEGRQVIFPIETLNLTRTYLERKIEGPSLVRLGCSALGCAGARRIIEDRMALRELILDVCRDPLLDDYRKEKFVPSTYWYLMKAIESVGQDFTQRQYNKFYTGDPTGKREDELTSLLEYFTGKTAEQHWEEGLQSGTLIGAREMLTEQVEMQFSFVPEPIAEKIGRVRSRKALAKLVRVVYLVDSLEEFEEELDAVLEREEGRDKV